MGSFSEMNTYKEIKEIAKCLAKINHLAEKLSKKIDVEGVDWSSATFVSISKEDIDNFDPVTSVTEDYLVAQSTGYCEDDYYGYLFFKTDVPGQFVRVYYEM